MSAVYRRDDVNKRRIIEINKAILDAIKYQRKIRNEQNKNRVSNSYMESNSHEMQSGKRGM